MKRINLFLLFFGLLYLTSCEKEESVDRVAFDDELIQEYLEDNNINATKHESGLYYLIEQEGNGKHPHANSLVDVKYKGYLLDGSVFDQGTIPGWNLQDLIQGWIIGIPLFSVGGTGKLFIPSYLGYGSSSRTGIPANSVLIFDIELLNIK